MNQILKIRKRINFQDCDPLTHLNNLSYIRYFIDLREDLLYENQIFDIQEHAMKTGKSWVILSHNIKFIRPAFFGDIVEIWSRVLAYEMSRNLVEFFMFCPRTRQLKSVMHTQFGYFSIQDKKMVPLDAEMEDLLKQACVYPGVPMRKFSIEERIPQIRAELT